MLEKGLVDQEGLTRALKSQEVMGGRLGTALVDMKQVTISTVSACLSYQRGVPDATRDMLLSVKDDIVALLTRKQCSRHKIIPLKKEGRVLHLGMLDPQALDTVDDVAFSVGCTVKPYIIAEIRLHLYLEIFYDVPRERRFAAFRDVDEVSTAKPRRGRRTKRSLFRLPGKGAKKKAPAKRESGETPPEVSPPQASAPPAPTTVPATPSEDALDLVSLDSYTEERRDSVEKHVITSAGEEPIPAKVSEDQSQVPTQVTAYPETPDGAIPLAGGHTEVVSDQVPPPLTRSEYDDVPIEPGLPVPAPRAAELDSMSETAEMFTVDDEGVVEPGPHVRPSSKTAQEFAIEDTQVTPTPGTNQGYPAVQEDLVAAVGQEIHDDFEAEEEQYRPPSKTQPGIAAVDVEPAPEAKPEAKPEPEPEEEPSSSLSFEMDNGDDPPAKDDKTEGEEDVEDFGEFVPGEAGADDEFSSEELTGGIDGVSTPEDAIRHLRKSEVRDDITRLLVSPFVGRVNLSILFLVRQGNFMALRANGSGARDEEIRAMVVSLANPSLLQRAYKQKTVLRAPAESDPLQQMISGHLRVGEPEEVCVAPIVLAGRVVNVLCIQSRPGRRFPKDVTDQVQQVCEEASIAYTRLIQKTKK